MKALVITGPPGSGKSRTVEALSDLLHDRDAALAIAGTCPWTPLPRKRAASVLRRV